MTVLIIGGHGRVGTPTASGIAKLGKSVRVLTRSADHAKATGDGIEGIVGDLENPSSLPQALVGVDQLFLVTSNGETETQRGLNAVQAAIEAKVKRIVFLSVKLSPEALQVPHYASKVAIEEAIKKSGANITILRPDFFFQTDLTVGGAIMGGNIYPMPIGNIGQNRIDTRDIADAAIRALTTNELDNQDIELFGPKAWTGDEIASLYGNLLKKSIKYGGDDLDAWAEASKKFMPPWLLNALKAGFAKMQKVGSVATSDQVALSASAVGHPLRRYEDFAEEAIKAWSNT
jgi:uncharacterized protein YbjT (DUF2867 family)